MRFIQNMIDRRRVAASLRDYPIYSAPFHYGKETPSLDEMRANFNYFLEKKAERLEYLVEYLASFSIILRLEPAALPELGRWLYRYGGHLVPVGPGGGIDGRAFFAVCRYERAWVDEFCGLNVINDISIFAGDYIVSKNRNAWWDLWYGDGTRRSYELEGFGQPSIFGLTQRRYQGHHHHSMLVEIDRCCAAGRERLMPGRLFTPPQLQPWNDPREFERLLSHLSEASAPPIASS
jgi:hypothetical protein